MPPLDPHWLLFQLLWHPFSPILINGTYRAIIIRLQTGCKCASAVMSSSVWALFILILSSPSPLLWLLLPYVPFFAHPPFSVKSDIYCWSSLPRALMDYLSPAYPSSFRQHWLASSHILSASDAHFHQLLNTVSNMHDLLIFMQLLMLVAVATRDVDNS